MSPIPNVSLEGQAGPDELVEFVETGVRHEDAVGVRIPGDQ